MFNTVKDALLCASLNLINVQSVKNNTMNTYSKYAPNVFVAKSQELYEKGQTIIVTTKYGKENE